jgi:hypothetical protein
MSFLLPSLPKNVKIIKSKSSSVGLRYQGHSYVVGFSKIQKIDHAQIVGQFMRSDTRLRLRNVHLTNIIKDMQMLQPDLADTIDIDKVMMASNAMLIIEKGQGQGQGEKQDVKNNKFSNQTIGIDEFMLYPFLKNIGVLITNDVTDIGENHIVFDVHMIAPAFSTTLFDNY